MRATLGILGGMGPYAALEFAGLVMRATPAIVDTDHLHVILDNRSQIPSRHAAALNGAESPVREMVRGFRALAAAGADFVAVPCNAAHFFRDEVQAQVDISWLSMVDLVGSVVAARYQRTLVVGAAVTAQFRIYDVVLPKATYVSPAEVPAAGDIIDAVKAGTPVNDDLVASLVRELAPYTRAVDSVLLACTELTCLRARLDVGVPVTDSSSLYAARVAEIALASRHSG